MRAMFGWLSVYISSPAELVEVFYLPFPHFTGSHCTNESLVSFDRSRLDAAFRTAEEIVQRFVADGRTNATAAELKKAFSRSFAFA